MDLLISLLIFCIVFGLIYWIVTLIPLPDPFKTIAMVILLLIGVLVLIGYLLPLTGGHWPSLGRRC